MEEIDIILHLGAKKVRIDRKKIKSGSEVVALLSQWHKRINKLNRDLAGWKISAKKPTCP